MNTNQSKIASRAKKKPRLGRPLGVFWVALLLMGYGCGRPNSVRKPSSSVHLEKSDEDISGGLQRGDQGINSLSTATKRIETETAGDTTKKIPTSEDGMEPQGMRRSAARQVRGAEEAERRAEEVKRMQKKAERRAEEAASRVKKAEERVAQLTGLLRREKKGMILQHLAEGYTIDYIYCLDGVGCVFTREELEAIQAEYQGSQERIRIAYHLMRNHLPIELICSATRFTPEELECIKRRYKSPSPLPPSAE